jgi:Na+/H+-dicarboxylate symporter
MKTNNFIKKSTFKVLLFFVLGLLLGYLIAEIDIDKLIVFFGKIFVS